MTRRWRTCAESRTFGKSMNGHGLGMSPTGTSISAGSFSARLLERVPNPSGSVTSAGDAKALGQPHEVRIGEIGADQAIAMQGLLHVANGLP